MTDAKFPRPVEVFETSDSKIHRSLTAAEYHQKRIDGTRRCNEMLRAGASLGVAMRATGLLPDGCYPELDEVTCETKLVISHWQCRDQPGYRVIQVEDDGGVFVHGDAGSWSGSYGNVCSVMDVERYWKDTKQRAAREASRG